MTIKPRLNRMFASDGKCFDVAIDHGFFNEISAMAGIENMKRAVDAVLHAQPDAVQLSVGQAKLLQSVPGKQKPALVLRTDVANVYGKTLPSYIFSKTISEAVKQALRFDAACLCIKEARRQRHRLRPERNSTRNTDRDDTSAHEHCARRRGRQNRGCPLGEELKSCRPRFDSGLLGWG